MITVQDEKFVNSLLGSDSTFGIILKRISSYFSEEFKVGIISFYIPIINGPADNSNSNLLFILRNLYISDHIQNREEIESNFVQNKKILHLASIPFIEELLLNNPYEVCFDKIGQETFDIEYNFVQYSKSNKCIIIPIRNTINQFDNNDINRTNWKNLYGFFVLHMMETAITIEITERLKFLSTNYTHLINNILSNKKSQQIDILRQEMNLLDYSQFDTIYFQFACLISKVINAETCSVFIYNKLNYHLELKASTAKNAIYCNNEIKLSDFKYKEDIHYTVDETDSETVRSFIENQTYTIYSLKLLSNYSTKFIEKLNTTKFTDSTLLLIPLKNSYGDPVGVIRCLGTLISDENLIHSFWDYDREFIEFISDLTSRFIDYAQLNIEKDNFIRQVVHELLSPLAELLHSSEEFYGRMSRNNQLSDELVKYHKNIINNIMLQKQILIDLSSVSLKKSEIIVLNKSFEDISEILNSTIGLLGKSAFYEKRISIQNTIKNIPPIKIDRSKVQQVFFNILRNAITYSFENTTIRIIYKMTKEQFPNTNHKNWHEIIFENKGIGIPEQEKDEIFSLYRRGSNAYYTKPSGSGIGLFIVTQIMKAHEGLCIIRKANNPTEISVLFPNED